MYVIGLTGGIASGKSTVSAILRQYGAKIIDADLVAKELQEPHTPVWREIVDAFGEGVLTGEGVLNRQALAKRVFNDPSALATLNAIVHPRVIARTKSIIESSAAAGEKVVVVDAPLLLEANMQSLVDEVWLVAVPEELQVERLMARNGLTRAEALARLGSQMPLKDKLRLADKVIDNSGSVEQTREYVVHLWQELLHRIALREQPEG